MIRAAGLDQQEPCWLSASEQATWLALGALVTRLPAALEAELQESAGLSLFDYLVLSALSEAPGRTMCMGELGARVNSSPSRLSHGVARLQRHGWVCRAPLPEDGRQIIATLTPEGYSKVEASAPQHVRFVRRLVIGALSPAQLRQLHAIAEAINDRIDTALMARR